MGMGGLYLSVKKSVEKVSEVKRTKFRLKGDRLLKKGLLLGKAI